MLASAIKKLSDSQVEASFRDAWVPIRLVSACAFFRKRQWFQTIREAGLSVLSYSEPDAWEWPLRWEWKVFLHVGNVRAGHYWLGVTSAQG
jgi:hypothetical protein